MRNVQVPDKAILVAQVLAFADTPVCSASAPLMLSC
jgi:hypothetical protein